MAAQNKRENFGQSKIKKSVVLTESDYFQRTYYLVKQCEIYVIYKQIDIELSEQYMYSE